MACSGTAFYYTTRLSLHVCTPQKFGSASYGLVCAARWHAGILRTLFAAALDMHVTYTAGRLS
jgi:hypothetical protein